MEFRQASQTESVELCKAIVSYNICFYNNVYIHKNIYHFKIPQVIVIATRLLGRFFFTEYGPRTLSVGKTRDAAQAMIFLHNTSSRVRYIITVLSHDKQK
jgi:hypothetical protein